MTDKYISPVLENIRIKNLEDDLNLVHSYALNYVNSVNEMPVYPKDKAVDNLSVFDEPLRDEPLETKDIIDQLHTYGSPATVAQTGGRYFGFVCGGILPSALVSKWLTDTWDQNPAMHVLSPIASKLESVTERWIVDLLGLPEETVAGYVSGSSTATIIGLTTGRNYLLHRAGYDIFQKGLSGAPPIKVVLGEGAHSTVYKALSIIGLGSDAAIKVPADNQGRMRVDKLPPLDDMTLLILQAGHVNTGNFDDFEALINLAEEAGAYVHVDGAFGLWAAANKQFDNMTRGVQRADSWSVDGHKTLNTPYDPGIILCKHEKMLIDSMHMTGSYIILSQERDNMLYTAEMSRRTRAIDLWATLKGLGRTGVAELVWELYQKALYFAELLKQGGLEIVNEVVFNQILVRFESDDHTNRLIEKIQKSGVCWLGGAKWEGKAVMRISVCSYKTTYRDIDLSAEDILRLVKSLK